ncbi:hypothetical protein [Caballeronia sp. INML2]|nr:hypothetical protein [Caballeronia sp. INML2]
MDGNGRTGRLLLNIELMKSSYPRLLSAMRIAQPIAIRWTTLA